MLIFIEAALPAWLLYEVQHMNAAAAAVAVVCALPSCLCNQHSRHAARVLALGKNRTGVRTTIFDRSDAPADKRWR
jgi:hypothetical protein